MTDVELTRALERGEIANEKFRHASHLHVAWVYLSESKSVEEAANKMRQTLRRFAASAGKLKKYHETITLFWVDLLARARIAKARPNLGTNCPSDPGIAGKEFSVRLLFDGAAFQRQSSEFVG